nr:NADH-cytochrome b5 reductase 1 [Naematelia aurantialba]
MSTNENKYDKSTRGSQIVADYAAQITGKVVVITGGSPGGIGAFLADAIAAASPALIVIGVRDVAKGEATAAHLKTINPNVATRILEIDLASFTSVRKAAAEVNAYSEKIDVLINNAGVMALGAFTQTEDGHETQFQVNFLAPFLFTNLVADKLVQDKTRVVNVSSDGYRLSHVRFQDYGFHVSSSCTLHARARSRRCLSASSPILRLPVSLLAACTSCICSSIRVSHLASHLFLSCSAHPRSRGAIEPRIQGGQWRGRS